MSGAYDLLDKISYPIADFATFEKRLRKAQKGKAKWASSFETQIVMTAIMDIDFELPSKRAAFETLTARLMPMLGPSFPPSWPAPLGELRRFPPDDIFYDYSWDFGDDACGIAASRRLLASARSSVPPWGFVSQLQRLVYECRNRMPPYPIATRCGKRARSAFAETFINLLVPPPPPGASLADLLQLAYDDSLGHSDTERFENAQGRASLLAQGVHRWCLTFSVVSPDPRPWPTVVGPGGIGLEDATP